MLASAPAATDLRLDDLEIRTCKGSGPGGQHRNKTESGVEIIHRPTGMRVRCDRGRSQHQNRQEALGILTGRLRQAGALERHEQSNLLRRGQIGTGERSDKIRTIQVQHDQVRDHRTGRSITVRAWMRGHLDGLVL
jgi:peptide chain release factor 1